MNNEKWFDIKVLADVNAQDTTKVMKNDSYEAHIKTVLRRLNLSKHEQNSPSWSESWIKVS